jgi:hypothetical protein
MPKPNATRQAEFRKRHMQDVDGTGRRINQVVSVTTKSALERLAKHYAVTQRAHLQEIIGRAERELVERLTPDEQRKYYA